VIDRFAYLKRKRDEEKARETIDLTTRLDIAKEEEETERAEKRRIRNEKRRKTKDGMGVKEEVVENDGIIC